MKKQRTKTSIKRIKIRQKKIERLKIKSSKKKRQRNIINNNKKVSFKERSSNNDNFFKLPKRITVYAEANLSLLENTDNVLDFIKEIESVTTNCKKIILTLDLTIVVNIDIGCISILLSKINKLAQMNIPIICDLPKNEECRRMFFESGFSDHMRDLQGRKIKYSKKNNNLMVNRGFDKTSNQELGLAIKEAVNHLIGIKNPYQPVYSIAQEMCANSVEHANKHNKNWLFSVWYKNDDEVCFTMTDIGEGILGTLRRKFSQIIKELFLKNNKDILHRAFEKKYTSSTKDINRNKGLPKIKNIADRNYINNLIVITNDVMLDFSNDAKSKILKRKFNGTFYYWELNKNCIEIWKNRILM